MTFLRLIAIVLFATLFASTAMAAPGQRVGIAAIVNDDVITMSDLRNRVQLYIGGMPTQPSAGEISRIEKETLNRLIDEKLQAHEAKNLSIEATDEQIAMGFADIARQNNTTPEEFSSRLEKSGVKLDTLREQIKTEILWSQVVRRKLRPQVNVSEQEIDTELAQRTNKGGKSEYLVAEIFLPVESADAESRVRDQASDLVAELNKGGKFAEIARARSQSPGAANGGDIGWISQGQLEAPLDAALANMQPGQLSPPLRGKDGFHILFLRNRRDNGVAAVEAEPKPLSVITLKQLTIPVEGTEPQPVMAAKFARAEALASEITACEGLDAIASEFNTKTATGQQQRESLPAPIRAVLDPLPIGKVSKPVRTTKGYSVFMICGEETKIATPAPASAAPVANDEKTREEIANQLGMQRLSQLQERYLRDLRATAYIDRRL